MDVNPPAEHTLYPTAGKLHRLIILVATLATTIWPQDLNRGFGGGRVLATSFIIVFVVNQLQSFPLPDHQKGYFPYPVPPANADSAHSLTQLVVA